MINLKRFSVHWFDPEPSSGVELRKVRPCVIVSPDEMNGAVGTVIVVPLTSTQKPWPFRVPVTIEGRESSAACDQIRAVDTARLKGFIASLSAADGKALLGVLQEMFAD